MAGTALKIDDDYVLNMGETLSEKEKELQSGVDKYLEIMKKISEDAIKEGETAQALDTFITYAEELKDVISEHAVNVNKTCQKFKDESYNTGCRRMWRQYDYSD